MLLFPSFLLSTVFSAKQTQDTLVIVTDVVQQQYQPQIDKVLRTSWALSHHGNSQNTYWDLESGLVIDSESSSALILR